MVWFIKGSGWSMMCFMTGSGWTIMWFITGNEGEYGVVTRKLKESWCRTRFRKSLDPI